MSLHWFDSTFRVHTPKIAVAAALASGLGLVVAGQLMLSSPAGAGAVLAGILGPLALEGFPASFAWGLILLLAGALVTAVILGVPARQLVSPGGQPGLAATATSRRIAHVLVGLACVLSVATGYALLHPAFGPTGVFMWAGTLLVTLSAAVTWDRSRGTGFGNPFTRWEWVVLAVLVAADLLLVGHDLTHWAWGGVPDESYFFVAAKAIADGRLQRFPLSEEGVFGYHPLLSSYYQVLFMKLFGMNVFGWRLSSAVALAVSLPPVYLLMRELCSRRAGLIAAVVLGSTLLAVAYAHWGYNNAQVYPIITGSLGVLAWSVRRRSVAGHYLAGCLAGLGFYTFYPARLAPLLAALLAWSLGGLSWRRCRAQVMALALGVLMTVLPLAAHPIEMMAHMLQQTAFTGGEPAHTRVLAQWLQSMLYASWFHCSTNFDWNPVVDPIVAALAVVGMWLSVLAVLQRSPLRFLFPAYALSAFVVGAISQHDCPPLTRLLTLSPFTGMLAALALDQLMRWASVGVSAKRAAVTVGAALVAGSVVWNAAALHRSMYERHHGYGDGTTSELIRTIHTLPSAFRIVYVQGGDNDMYDVDKILAEYGLADRSTYIRPFSERAVEQLAALRPPAAVFYRLRNPSEAQRVEEVLAQRFPGRRWHDSDAGKRWNLRYLLVPTEADAGAPQPAPSL